MYVNTKEMDSLPLTRTTHRFAPYYAMGCEFSFLVDNKNVVKEENALGILKVWWKKTGYTIIKL